MYSISKVCSLSDCNSKYYAKGFCRIHWQRSYYHGDPYHIPARYVPFKHGMHNTPEYRAYQMMKQRCNNPKYPEYRYWGGKGIKVCNRWLESFNNFIEDMGMRPTPNHSLDRIDPNGNYEPSNCRWATGSLQMHNTIRKTGSKRYHNGVYKRNDRFVSVIGYKSVTHYISSFLTLEEAIMAYENVKEQIIEIESMI